MSEGLGTVRSAAAPTVLLLAAAFLAGSPVSAVMAQETLAALTFTAQQADAGQAAYRNFCASCHGAALQGAGGPRLDGGAFDDYRSRAVRSLFDFISQNMPADYPGTLTTVQYLSLVAFLARENGFTPGPTPLPGDPDALGAMGFRQ